MKEKRLIESERKRALRMYKFLNKKLEEATRVLFTEPPSENWETPKKGRVGEAMKTYWFIEAGHEGDLEKFSKMMKIAKELATLIHNVQDSIIKNEEIREDSDDEKIVVQTNMKTKDLL